MTQIKEEPFEIDQESQYLNGEDQNLDIESQYYTDSALLENVHYTTSQESNIKSEFPEETAGNFDFYEDPLQFSIKQENSESIPWGQKTKGKTKSQIAKEWRAKQDLSKIRQKDRERMRIKRAKIR